MEVIALIGMFWIVAAIGGWTIGDQPVIGVLLIFVGVVGAGLVAATA